MSANSGQIAALVGDALEQALFGQEAPGSAIHVGGPVERLGEARRTRADDQEILDVQPPSGMGAATEDLDLRQRQPAGLVATQMSPQRQAPCRGRCVRRGHRYGDRGVAAEAPLVRGAVELDQARVQARLVESIEPDQRRRDEPVHVGYCTRDVLAAERLAAVAQVDRLAAAGRGASRGDGAADRPARELELCLDGGPAPAVPTFMPLIVICALKWVA